MANANYSDTSLGYAPKGGGRSTKGTQGSAASMGFKEKPGFRKPGLPGKGGPNRSAGAPKRSKLGAPFYVDQEGFN